MITVTFSLDKDEALEPLLIRKLREFCLEEFGQEPVLQQTDVVRSACEHRFVTLVSGGRGLVQCSDCGEVF